MKYTRKSTRKSIKYRRKSVRTKNKTRKNKSRMMKRGGTINERSPSSEVETMEELQNKIADLKSRLNFTRETRDGYEKEYYNCHNEPEKLKEENEILEKEKRDLEIKMKEKKAKKSKIMKVGGAESKRTPLLPTKTMEKLQKQIDKLDNERAEVKEERDNFRNKRDECYYNDKLNQLKEQLNKENEKLKIEIKNLEYELQETSHDETNLSARNSNTESPPIIFKRNNNMTPEQLNKIEEKIKRAIHNAWVKTNERKTRRKYNLNHKIYNYKI